jgi:hypothetical protein
MQRSHVEASKPVSTQIEQLQRRPKLAIFADYLAKGRENLIVCGNHRSVL